MNIILLQTSDWIEPARVRLTERRAKHIRTILRAKIGDTLKVGKLGGNLGTGIIRALNENQIVLDVNLSKPPPPRHHLEVVMALPRPKLLRRVLRTAAEFGVERMHIIQSTRVEKSYWQSPVLQTEKIQAALNAGLERASDTLSPDISIHKRFRPFVEDELPKIVGDRICWLADPGANKSLSTVAGAPGVIMLGPEGGFIPFEIDLVCSVGARRAHLGKRVLSVDTALAAALAQPLL